MDKIFKRTSEDNLSALGFFYIKILGKRLWRTRTFKANTEQYNHETETIYDYEYECIGTNDNVTFEYFSVDSSEFEEELAYGFYECQKNFIGL